MRRWLLVVVLIGCGHEPGDPAIDASPEPQPATTYYRDVAPILGRNCVGCHRAGGLGPFELGAYEDARELAPRIAEVTAARIMPPWPAESSGSCNTFVGARGLPAADIATLAAWTALGAPAGDPADLVPVTPIPDPPFSASVSLAGPAPYTVSANRDEYRCFVIDPSIDSDRYITAVGVQLDKAEIVHHVQLFAVDTAGSQSLVLQQDAADPGPGYECASDIGANVRYIGVWAAGDRIRRWPDNTGVRVGPNALIVLQFHYHNHTAAPITDHSHVELELATSVDSIATIGSVAAYPLSLPPGMSEVVASAEVAVPITDESWARAVRIHMHTLGAHARMELVRGTHTECLLEIPRWDFGWQLFYTFESAIALEPGDKIRITCAYDTRSRTTTTSWGSSTDDEMCLGYTYFHR